MLNCKFHNLFKLFSKFYTEKILAKARYIKNLLFNESFVIKFIRNKSIWFDLRFLWYFSKLSNSFNNCVKRQWHQVICYRFEEWIKKLRMLYRIINFASLILTTFQNDKSAQATIILFKQYAFIKFYLDLSCQYTFIKFYLHI